jgi:hypothetical protein
MDCREYIDIATRPLDLLAQVKLLMQPRRGHRASAYCARIIRGDH